MTARFGPNRAAARPPGMPPRSAPAPYAPTRSPAPAFESWNSSAYSGTRGVSAVNNKASTKMIALTRKRRRRTLARIRRQRKCTEPVASSSDLPTDHRRSDNHSESHQPQTLRSRCIGDSMDRIATGQAPLRRISVQFAHNLRRRRDGGDERVAVLVRTGRARRVSRAGGCRSTTKCTEPVAPSSGFPTDRRRSDCRSGSHQPRTLRTRCIADSRGRPRARQGVQIATSRKLRSFLFATAKLRLEDCALDRRGTKKRPGTRARPQRVRRAGNAFVHLPDEPSASA